MTDLSSSLEDYIEAIAVLTKRNNIVRVKDIANYLKIKMPSVTAALIKLRDKGLIIYEKYSDIRLTRQGESISGKVLKKHSSLYNFLTEILNLDKKQADQEACRIEHVLSADTCKRLEKFVNFYRTEKNKGSEWVNQVEKLFNSPPGSI